MLFNLQIITPELTLEYLTSIIILPGVDGIFSVLYGHENMLALICEGTLTIKNNEEISCSLYIGKGVIKIAHNQCILLTEFANF